MNMHQPKPELPEYWKRRAAELVQTLQADLGVTPDGKVGRETTNALAPLTDALRAQHRTLSEREHFMIEAAVHHGARMLDAEGKVFVVTQEQLVSLMQSYQSPAERVLTAAELGKWIADQIAEKTVSHRPADERPDPWIRPEDATLIATEAVLRMLQDKASLITALADDIHGRNVRAGWWTDLNTGEDLHGKRNVGELLMLCVSELAEAMEGHRKKLMDDKLPQYPMLRVELIDCIIRCLDLLGSDYAEQRVRPAGEIFQAKLDFNAKREDHKPENRRAAGGKSF